MKLLAVFPAVETCLSIARRALLLNFLRIRFSALDCSLFLMPLFVLFNVSNDITLFV